MPLEERIAILKSLDLFHSFSDGELLRFAERIEQVSYAQGEMLFQEGDAGMDMFILLDGVLKVVKDNRTITKILPVDYVGEMALIESKPRSATIEVLAPSVLMKVSSEQFLEVVEQPLSLWAMMKVLSRRIRRDTEILAEEFEKANIIIHDMKNILSPFLFLDSLKKILPEEGPSRHYIAHMKEARRNLLMMLDEALANAKRLQRPVPFAVASLPGLVQEMHDSYFAVHPDIMDKDINVVVTNHLPDFVFCRLDIMRVLANLVLNAAQASPPGGTIDIEVSTDSSHAKVTVKDYGTGIPSEIAEKIFRPHFTTKPDGSGFGLPSCKNIIEKRHQGRISFESVPGEGTSFRFSIPLERPH